MGGGELASSQGERARARTRETENAPLCSVDDISTMAASLLPQRAGGLSVLEGRDGSNEGRTKEEGERGRGTANLSRAGLPRKGGPPSPGSWHWHCQCQQWLSTAWHWHWHRRRRYRRRNPHPPLALPRLDYVHLVEASRCGAFTVPSLRTLLSGESPLPCASRTSVCSAKTALSSFGP